MHLWTTSASSKEHSKTMFRQINSEMCRWRLCWTQRHGCRCGSAPSDLKNTTGTGKSASRARQVLQALFFNAKRKGGKGGRVAAWGGGGGRTTYLWRASAAS